MDAVVEQTIVMKLQALKGNSIGAIMWDLKEYYEHIDRGKLLW